ncbi:MAG: undecaprenyl-diphosphatase, partial [Thermoleophilaceae bacterium]|nr:undecaprenyl-diphosphatase [Thermoleophilaceae bacterium]
MGAFEAIVLGIVQGLTEFLPISSTGHLRIVPAFAGWDDPGAGFTAVVQLGTTVAVLLYFREDLWRVVRAFLGSLRDPERRKDADARLGWYLILATIPIGLLGLIFKNQIEHGARDLYLIGTALIVFSFVILAAERYGPQLRKLREIVLPDAVAVGIAQALALIPGVSRSGATISAGLFRGLDRESAARFSFLISLPAIVLAALFEMRGVVTGKDTVHASAGLVVLSCAFAFVFGYASIAFLLRFVTRHSLGVFVGYRIVLGAVVL